MRIARSSTMMMSWSLVALLRLRAPEAFQSTTSAKASIVSESKLQHAAAAGGRDRYHMGEFTELSYE